MIDVVVIGGGPAGASAAIHLATQGVRVRLFEKSKFPRAKLCGGFLSSESIPEFETLGVWDRLQRAGHETTRVLVSSSRGTTAECGLRTPALSLSRDILDQTLLNRARDVGVDVVEKTDGLAHRTDAPWCVIAAGRRPPPQSSTKNAYYGFQASFENVQGITDQVELDSVPGGYVGLARHDSEGTINLCGLLHGRAMRAQGSDLDAALKRLAVQPVLTKRLISARRISAWKTVGPVVMGVRQLTEAGTFFVGDAACVVDPFAGEGVAMGLIGGRLLAQAFREPPDARLKTYENLWHTQFDGAIRLQRAICWNIASPLWQELLVRACRMAPPLMRWLTNGTRAPTNGAHALGVSV